MRSLWVLPLVFLFVSCETITGTLKLEKDLVVLKKKRKEVVKMIYPKNNYLGKVSVSSSKVKFNFDSKINGKKIKPIEIKVEKAARYKLKRMKFILEPQEISQNFAMAVNRDEYSERSEDYHGRESCSYLSHYERRCQRTCEKVKQDDGSYKKVCRKTCRDVPIYIHGYQEVSYYYLTKYIDVNVQILEDSLDEESVIAYFNGGDSSRSKLYNYKGYCY